jgi:hypothetical protein
MRQGLGYGQWMIVLKNRPQDSAGGRHSSSPVAKLSDEQIAPKQFSDITRLQTTKYQYIETNYMKRYT